MFITEVVIYHIKIKIIFTKISQTKQEQYSLLILNLFTKTDIVNELKGKKSEFMSNFKNKKNQLHI